MDVASIQQSFDRTDVAAHIQTPTPDIRRRNLEVVKAVKAVNQSELFGAGRELTYSIDRGSKRVVTKLIDTNTDTVIDQFPAEYLLRLADEVKQKA